MIYNVSIEFIVAAALLLPNSGSTPEGWSSETEVTDDEVTSSALLEEQHDLINNGGDDDDTESDTIYFRATVHQCLTDNLEGSLLRLACEEGRETIYEGLDCDEDAVALEGLFAVTQHDNGSQSNPELVSEGLCITPADLADQAQRAFRTMPIEPAQILLQVERDWAIVNFGVHPRTDADPQIMDTTLLGVPVQIRATPDEFTWDAGDDTAPVITDQPGGQWDSAEAIHLPYPAPGTFAVSLTTTWHGQFRITGTPTWTDIDGQATTTDTTYPIEVHEAEVRLTG